MKMNKSVDGLKFKMKYIDEYGHKTMLVIFHVLGYYNNQSRKRKPCFLTKNQIKDSLFGKVSFTTIKKAKKVLNHYFNLKTIKRDSPSLRECKYE